MWCKRLDMPSVIRAAGGTPPVYRHRQYPEPFPTGHYTAGGVTVGVFFLRKLPHIFFFFFFLYTANLGFTGHIYNHLILPLLSCHQ